jgi:hypothetical protein
MDASGLFLLAQIFAEPLFSRGPAKIAKAFTDRIRHYQSATEYLLQTAAGAS